MACDVARGCTPSGPSVDFEKDDHLKLPNQCFSVTRPGAAATDIILAKIDTIIRSTHVSNA